MITVVAILSTVAIVYYGNFLKNSRDVRRQADLKLIQSALEAYHGDALHYPPAGEVLPDSQLSYTPNPPNPAKIYLNQIPNDPLNITPYLYRPQGNGYCLFAKLENPGSVRSDPGCNSNFPDGGYNYGVTRP